jgi:hypothetical protein
MAAFEYQESGYATRYPSSGLVQLSGSAKTVAPNGVGSGVAFDGVNEGAGVDDGDAALEATALTELDGDAGATGEVAKLAVASRAPPPHPASISAKSGRNVGVRMAPH